MRKLTFFASFLIAFMERIFRGLYSATFAGVTLSLIFMDFSMYYLLFFGYFKINFNKLFEISVEEFCFCPLELYWLEYVTLWGVVICCTGNTKFGFTVNIFKNSIPIVYRQI